ncbi:FMN-dependent dehydrogenase-domain-containing protein [Leucosporidium creatinivorum]|uniref:FMN-dependent dehydrogenase-domain-containing protein n=1 Tax=Leucosporidium creatinivorum TaxID=106004 RepID=A0A1Y2F7X4_9BASI|nr:FMN-dependent dehydrogenase-domain-containing protein [Leucosporidium creatinivorum]
MGSRGCSFGGSNLGEHPRCAFTNRAELIALLQLATAEPLALETPQNAPALVSKRKLSTIEGEEVKKHNTRDSAWVVIDGVVFDVTKFLEGHPGGEEVLLEHLGKDISPIFSRIHASDVLQKTIDSLGVVGLLSKKSADVLEVVPAVEGEEEIEARRSNLPDPEYVINLGEFEKMAKEVLGEDSRAWRFFSSFADDGATYKASKNSFSFLRFLPRVNIPVSQISTATSYLGNSTPIPLPILICPTGASASGHPDGELNMTRASSLSGIPQIVSTMSSVSFSDLAAERDRLVKEEGRKKAPLWWQLYIKQDRKESEKSIQIAAEAGAEAIVITVDVASIGKREADAPRGKLSGGVAASGSKVFDGKRPRLTLFPLSTADMSWADIDWVKKHAPGVPVLVKGINTVEDVILAKKHGARGVFLSTHGGRQLDHSPPPMATLVRLRKERPDLLKDENFDVFIDGGVHRGTDVLKALCLGAKGVGLGRTFLYAQTCYGDAGITRAKQILAGEIESGMKLLGARSVKELKPEMIELLPGLVGEQMK